MIISKLHDKNWIHMGWGIHLSFLDTYYADFYIWTKHLNSLCGNSAQGQDACEDDNIMLSLGVAVPRTGINNDWRRESCEDKTALLS